jgi:uridine kinase
MTYLSPISFSEIAQAISNCQPKSGHARIVSIDGPAGAGKTTLAKKLTEYFSTIEVAVVHMDDLYEGWDNALTPSFTRTLEFGIALPVNSGKSFEYRKFDWLSMRFGDMQRHPLPDLLILEGVGSGQKALRKYLDHLIWIEVPTEVGLNRVLRRDGDYIETEMRIWQMRESEHFKSENTRDCATIRVDGMNFI